MKKKYPILGIICLAVLVCGGVYAFRAGGAQAEMTIGEKTYEMRTRTSIRTTATARMTGGLSGGPTATGSPIHGEMMRAMPAGT